MSPSSSKQNESPDESPTFLLTYPIRQNCGIPAIPRETSSRRTNYSGRWFDKSFAPIPARTKDLHISIATASIINVRRPWGACWSPFQPQKCGIHSFFQVFVGPGPKPLRSGVQGPLTAPVGARDLSCARVYVNMSCLTSRLCGSVCSGRFALCDVLQMPSPAIHAHAARMRSRACGRNTDV